MSCEHCYCSQEMGKAKWGRCVREYDLSSLIDEKVSFSSCSQSRIE